MRVTKLPLPLDSLIPCVRFQFFQHVCPFSQAYPRLPFEVQAAHSDRLIALGGYPGRSCIRLRTNRNVPTTNPTVSISEIA
jgi:hypothetical protein